MKTIKVNFNSVNLAAKLSLLTLAALIFIKAKSYSQAPPLQWNFTSEFDNPYLRTSTPKSGEDWLYNIIGTSDGGSLGVGFAYLLDTISHDTIRYPAAVKLYPDGTKEWIRAYKAANSLGGNFWDVVELDGYYYMVGTKLDPNDMTHDAGVLVKTDLAGNAIYYKYFRITNLTDFSTWESNHNTTPYPLRNTGFRSVKTYVDPSSGDNRLMLCGTIGMEYSSQGMDVAMGALLVNVDESGNIISGFGYNGNGYQIYMWDDDINNRTIGTHVTTSADPSTGEVNGFVLTGSTLHAPFLFATKIHCCPDNGTGLCPDGGCMPHCDIKDRDVYLVKTDMTGDIVWDNTFDQGTFTIGPSVSECATCPSSTFSEAGMQTEQKPCSNDFIVLGHFNFNVCYCTPCGLIDILTILDAAVFGVNGATGAYSSSVFTASLADHFASKDFVAQMEVLGDGSVVVAGNKPTGSTWPDFTTELVKLPPGGGAPVWVGNYAGSDVVNCNYGLAQALDGGFLMADINGLNQDDFDIIKTGSDLACSGYLTYTQGGYAHNGVPGQYLLNNFDICFPSGLTVGCDYTLYFTTKNAVRTFLSHHGSGTSVALTANEVDLVTPHCEFERQVVTLTLNVGFDLCDDNFAPAYSNLQNLYVTLPPFTGLTVGQVLTEANNALGGCGSSYSLSDLNVVVTAINESYDPSGCNGNTYCNILSCHYNFTCELVPPAIQAGNCDVKVVAAVTTKECRAQFYDITEALNGSIITGCHWDFGDETSSNSRTPLHTYSHPGEYTVCLTDFGQATNPDGGSCQKTECYTVTIDDECMAGECSLEPDFYYEEENCKVAFTDVTESGSNTTITEWSWDFGDNSFSNFQNPVHTFAKPGVYNVCLHTYGNNMECENETCKEIEITEDCISEDCSLIPDFHYVVNGCTLHLEDFSSSNSTTINSYTWINEALGELNGDQANFVLSGGGTYNICLHITGFDGFGNECENNICKEIHVADDDCVPQRMSETFGKGSTSIGNISYKVTPNPSEGNFELRFISPLKDVLHIEINNFYGQLIERKTVSIDEGANKFVYNFSDKAKGIYSLKLFNDSETHFTKLVIQ